MAKLPLAKDLEDFDFAALIRNGTRGRFFNVVDLVNRLDTESRGGNPMLETPTPAAPAS